MSGAAGDCRSRILSVLAHIQDNLSEELGLDGLAAMAGFSPFHFHRLFLGVTGETLGAHIRRLRLLRAATRLEFSGATVTDIGFDAGYEATEAFSRAFKAQFGESPSLFREASRGRRREQAAMLFPEPEDFLDRDLEETVRKQVSVVRRGSLRVAYARATGPYQESGRKAWERLMPWVLSRGLLKAGAKCLGVGRDDPGHADPERIRYDACVTVGPDTAAEGEIGVATIPGGEHASLIHKGPYDELGRTYMLLYRYWLPRSGRVTAMRPGYEVYLNNPSFTPPEELLTEINIPLEPK